MAGESAEEILKKYGAKIQSQLKTEKPSGNYSEEYQRFRSEMVPELTRYERWAKSLGNFISLKVSEKDRMKIQRYLDVAHLDVSASQALTLALMSMLIVFFLTILSAVSYVLIAYPDGIAGLLADNKGFSDMVIFVFLGVISSLFVFYYAYSMPQRLATQWRLQASSQMVPAVLYVVVYMKHTSNLEKAIEFAGQHLEGPLALDLKKIFYDVEIGKFSTIKQSLESYLIGWKDYAPEFIESFHLIESSLFEPAEGRRVDILERSLQVILDGVYEKMLKFSREIRSPLTNLYMLGIILPTLGLALLPLASTLLGGVIRWPHIFVIFNVIIPFGVFYLVSEVLLKRPGGYGESAVLEANPDYESYRSKKPWLVGALIALPFLIIGLSPFLFQLGFVENSLGLQKDYTFASLGADYGDIKFFDFKDVDGKMVGPFGPVAILLSLFIPFSFMIFFSYAYSAKTKKMIKARNDTKQLEREFANSLFQLGNRIGDNVPAEIAFGKVANATQGEKSSEFFSLVNYNIQQGGHSLEQAIFDRRRGAIIYYPSALIATSMRILVESVKKGLQIAARSLMSISEYVKNIEKINSRLRDLLSEIVSDMKSNMVFLAPLLAGIVVGLASMITFILNKLQGLQVDTGGADVSGLGSFSTILGGFFNVKEMIPPYFLQVSIGIYMIQIIFILTGALVTVDSGKDVLREKHELSKNLKRGVMIYLVTSLIALLALIVLSVVALSSIGGGTG